MIGQLRRWTGAIAFTAALTCMIATGGQAADEAYPIWWSPKLELDSLDTIDARLARPFWDAATDEGGLELYPDGDHQQEPREARTCAELLELRERGNSAAFSNDFKIMMSLASRCRAIAALKTARPAERSFVQGFRFDRTSLDVIPAMALLAPGCEALCWQYAANQQRISVAEASPDIEITGVDDLRIAVEAPNVDRSSLELVGRADFDGDGLEDLFVIYETHAIGGTYGATRDLLLTRNEAGQVLTVVNADRHLCPDYECTPPNDEPPALRQAD